MCSFAYFKEKTGLYADVKTFSFHQFLVEKAGLCGGKDPALSAVRPPVNTTFLEMALALKRLPTPALMRILVTAPSSRLACFVAMPSPLFNIMKIKLNYIKLKWWEEPTSKMSEVLETCSC